MSAYITPKHKRDEDFNKLDGLILSLEHKADSQTLTITDLHRHQDFFNKFNDKYKNDPSFSPKDRGLFKPLEYRALLFLAEGDEGLANSLLEEAASLKHPNEKWISNTAKKWEANNLLNESAPVRDNALHFSGSIEGWLSVYAIGLFGGVFVILLDIFSSLPQLKNEMSKPRMY